MVLTDVATDKTQEYIMAEKVEVSIDADGNVLKCAKGASAADCGFTPGAKVCAKCGAVPVDRKSTRLNSSH